jgi:hypothetical protein
MQKFKRMIQPKSMLGALLVLMFTLTAFLGGGCTVSGEVTAEVTEAPSIAGEMPTAVVEPTTAPVTPTPVPITFSVPDNDVVNTFMSIELLSPINETAAKYGDPKDIYGQDGYAYKAVAGAADQEEALVYRFVEDETGLEFIVSASDARILKKQVSSPDAFPKLLDNASDIAVSVGMPYAGLRSAAGVDPYLWMSFVLPNAQSVDNLYEVCLWPDDDGQLVALVQNGVVLGAEYQPDDMVLEPTAVDGVTPRVPRYLITKPENANNALSKYDPFEDFADIDLGTTESKIISKLGTPTQTKSESGLHVLTYAFSDADFAGGVATFEYYVTDDASKILVAKRVVALPNSGEEVRGRYAMQMLNGMSLDDIEAFMGKPLKTNRAYTDFGVETVSYSYVGLYGAAGAVFTADGAILLSNEATVSDPLEADTLYEEYVLPVDVSRPKPNATPAPTLTIVTDPPIFASPTPTIPIFTFIIPSFPIIIVTPTPPIIR